MSDFPFTLPRSVLREALAKVLPAIATNKASLLISAHVLVEASDDRLTLSATDFDTTITLSVPASTTSPGSVALPARRLADIVTSLAAGDLVAISVTGTLAKIRAGRSSFEVSGLAGSEFPRFDAPGSEGRRTLTIPVGAFVSAVVRAAPTTSTIECRPVAQAICLDVEGGRFVAVATDQKTILRLDVADADGAPGGDPVLIPNSAASALSRLFGAVASDAPLALTSDSSSALLAVGDASLRIRLVAGPYYDYRPPLRNEPRFVVECDRVALALAMKRCVLAAGDARRVEVVVTPTEMSLFSTSSDAGTARDVVDITARNGTDAEFTIALHASQIVRALDAFAAERVCVGLSAPTSPVHLYPANRAFGDATVAVISSLNPNWTPAK